MGREMLTDSPLVPTGVRVVLRGDRSFTSGLVSVRAVTSAEWCISGHSGISVGGYAVLPCSWVGRAIVRSRGPETLGMASMRLPGSTHLAARCLTTTRPLIRSCERLGADR
jgi:hypothetical protein